MLICNYCAVVNNRGTHCSSCKRALEISPDQKDILRNAGYDVRRIRGMPPNWEWTNEKIKHGYRTYSTLQATALDAWVEAWHDNERRYSKGLERQKVYTQCKMPFVMEDKDLQAKLLQKIDKLELLIDCVGETPIRHKLSELIVTMRKTVRDGHA